MKTFFLFLIFFACHTVYQYYNMFVAKNSYTLKLFDYQFSTEYGYTFFTLLAFTPILSIANFGFGYGFSFGIKQMPNNILMVTTYFLAAQLLSIITSSYLLYGLNVSKGTIAGFGLAMTGVAVANLWK
jgi:hypothetical protein